MTAFVLVAPFDLLEACYLMLRGIIRDYATRQQRPFVRFFAPLKHCL